MGDAVQLAEVGERLPELGSPIGPDFLWPAEPGYQLCESIVGGGFR